eukprot:TRINITY_DN16427_c0_g1_i1.p1 TRINITY_DN16427_c0_g1~~TRINITY_DN16427_c0_g1_i1.p1  ORF type:complete len:268 (+),score=55.03 TRINITY_DN16427_c0_g1_i1:59-805(+)
MAYAPPEALGNMMAIAPGSLSSNKVSAAPVVVDEKKQNKVYVAPLGPGISEHALKLFFESCGGIVRIAIHQSKGDHFYAFIEFTKPEEAQKACRLSGLAIGDRCVKVQPCQDQKEQATDVFGLRPVEKSDAELTEEWGKTHALAATAAEYERWKTRDREDRAKAIQEKTIRKLKKQQKKRKAEGLASETDSEFDSALSTEERHKRKEDRQRYKKKGKKRRRELSHSSTETSSGSSSLPSPPLVFYQGP